MPLRSGYLDREGLFRMDIDIESPDTIRVFTDGSCYPNPNGNGGWAFSAEFRGQYARRHGWQSGVTNNVMEIRAIHRALQFVPAGEKYTRPLVIFSDSEYAIKALTEWHLRWYADGWRTGNGKPVANLSELRKVIGLIHRHMEFRQVVFRKVRGHSGIPENEFVDRLANTARKERSTDWEPDDVRTTAEPWGESLGKLRRKEQRQNKGQT